MGHCSASDAYTKRYDDAVVDIDRKLKCVDDVLLFDHGIEQGFWHCWKYLEACGRAGVTLSPEKFSFCKREVEFVGFKLGWDAYGPAHGELTAIADFPMLSNPTITDIGSFVGLVNQMATFMATAPIMEPFRALLKNPQTKHVYWDDQLKKRCEEVESQISKLVASGLPYYDKDKPTALLTDWSRTGVYFVVLQQHCSCSSGDKPFCCPNGWKLTLCGSRFLTPAEQRYAAVEGEALAVVWALQKAKLFLLGCPSLEVITDHRPLVKLFSNRELKDISNHRLFRLKEKTLPHRFTMRFRPGKLNAMADTLSRYPVERTQPSDADRALDDELTVAALTAVEECSNIITVDQEVVRRHADGDGTYQLLRQRVEENGWPESCSEEVSELKTFFQSPASS